MTHEIAHLDDWSSDPIQVPGGLPFATYNHTVVYVGAYYVLYIYTSHNITILRLVQMVCSHLDTVRLDIGATSVIQHSSMLLHFGGIGTLRMEVTFCMRFTVLLPCS